MKPTWPIPFFDGGRWSLRDVWDFMRGGEAEIEIGDPEVFLQREAQRLGVEIHDYRGWARDREYKEFGWFRNPETGKYDSRVPLRGRSYGARSWEKTTAVMLHTADTVMKAHRFIGTPVHLAVSSEPAIVLLHPLNALCAHGNAANSFSVGIEISGRRGAINDLQIRCGRALLRYCLAELKRHRPGDVAIMAHRQSDYRRRAGDPGPKIWRTLGSWAQRELGYVMGPTLRRGKDVPGTWT